MTSSVLESGSSLELMDSRYGRLLKSQGSAESSCFRKKPDRAYLN
jgi:hypothetical protein